MMPCDNQFSWLKERSYTVTLLSREEWENVRPDKDDTTSVKIFTDGSRQVGKTDVVL